MSRIIVKSCLDVARVPLIGLEDIKEVRFRPRWSVPLPVPLVPLVVGASPIWVQTVIALSVIGVRNGSVSPVSK